MQLTIRFNLISIFLVLLVVMVNISPKAPTFAQTREKQRFICTYGGGNHGAELCEEIRKNSFASNQHAERAVDMILKPLGLRRNFVLVLCPDINNAAAILPRADGLRYIVYDNAFMEGIDRGSKTNWASVSILAHEIGHHLQGHTTLMVHNPPTKEELRRSRENELEADEFSGFAMFKMRTSLSQAQAAIRNIRDVYDEENATHPKKSRRLEAIRRGYENARSQEVSTTDEKLSVTIEETMARLLTILTDKAGAGTIFVGHGGFGRSDSHYYRFNGCTLSVDVDKDEGIVIPFSNINPLSIKGYKIVRPPIEGAFLWMVDMKSSNSSFKRVMKGAKRRVTYSSEASFEFYRPEAQIEFIKYAERAARLCGGTVR